jgi:hypothetical protein
VAGPLTGGTATGEAESGTTSAPPHTEHVPATVASPTVQVRWAPQSLQTPRAAKVKGSGWSGAAMTPQIQPFSFASRIA